MPGTDQYVWVFDILILKSVVFYCYQAVEKRHGVVLDFFLSELDVGVNAVQMLKE